MCPQEQDDQTNNILPKGTVVLKQPVQEWQSTIDGSAYLFKCEHEKGFTYTVTANGEQATVKGRFLSMMFGFDEPFTVDGKKMRLIAARGGMDVAYDGRYLIADKPYIARPAWVWIFVILCISLIFMGVGFLGGVIGFIGAIICLSASRTDTPLSARILLCIFITVATWAVGIVVLSMLAGPIGT